MQEIKRDLTCFTNINDKIPTSDDAWNNGDFRHKQTRIREYTLEDIERIIESGSIESMQKLSYNFYLKDGLYKRILVYYATLLKYAGIVIPCPEFGKKLSEKSLQKRYFQSARLADRSNLPELFTRISIRALVYGGYFGIVQGLDKDGFTMLDLPMDYSRTRFKDSRGNNLVEFNVTYFDSIIEESVRRVALKTYPKEIATHYTKYKRNQVSSPWVMLPAGLAIYFSLFDDGIPFFLNVIPATIQYDDAVDTEREKEMEEIRKIIVQHMPHLNDGQLVFEPEEALEMHKGAVKMLKGNKNLSVLTSYADVEAIVSKTSSDNLSNSLEKMLQNVYSESGVSGQIFAPTGTQALSTSIDNDTAFMMILGNKYSRFMGELLTSMFGNSTIYFKYTILPITYYNQSDFITDTFKLAQSGYSFILPALAAGLSQFDLINVKSLENDVLKLQDYLIPLESAYTQSASGEAGRPELDVEDKSPKTIQNEDAIDNQGGSK